MHKRRICNLKLSKSTWITLFIAAIFLISFVAAGYYYYVVPRLPSLRILYTSSEQVLNDVAGEFKEWYGRQVEVKLIAIDPQTAYERVTNPYEKPEAEIWWGGSLSLFKSAYGSLLPYNSTNKGSINTTCHFCPLMDLEQSTPRWYAASLHGLGVMYNQQVLDALGLSVPKNWEEIVKIEKYEENVTMTDLTRSEYTSPFIMLILQSKNWTSGWEYLVQLSAFIKHFDDNEAKSALKVASGYLSVAILPDSYAYDRMALSISGINFAYLNTTVLQPDPIAIIKRGTYLEEAKAFIDFILTEEAQDIIGEYRLPIHENAMTTPPRINPFDPNFPHVPNYNRTFEKIIKDYYKTWVAERHEEEPSIRTAWKEIKEANETSPYYALAWNNFTMAGYYKNRTDIDAIYRETDGWTENITEHLEDWRSASKNAYDYATRNAEESQK